MIKISKRGNPTALAFSHQSKAGGAIAICNLTSADLATILKTCATDTSDGISLTFMVSAREIDTKKGKRAVHAVYFNANEPMAPAKK